MATKAQPKPYVRSVKVPTDVMTMFTMKRALAKVLTGHDLPAGAEIAIHLNPT